MMEIDTPTRFEASQRVMINLSKLIINIVWCWVYCTQILPANIICDFYGSLDECCFFYKFHSFMLLKSNSQSQRRQRKNQMIE
jgi:hypothetical protein